MANEYITVGISDMKMTRQQGIIATYALGSCIGICLYDPVIKLGSMIHIMLPSASDNYAGNTFKFADTGIAETLRKMEVFGARRTRLVAKIAGGAKMFNVLGDSDFGNIGGRNIDMVRSILGKEKIPIRNQDVGGTVARTLLLNVENGDAVVKIFGQNEKIL